MKSLEVNQADEKIKNIFVSFINEMNKWEKESQSEFEKEDNPDFDITHSRNVLRQKLEIIYLEFCTIKKTKHRRLESLSFGTPPNYDIANLEILSLEKTQRKCIIYTKQLNRSRDYCRYTLINKSNKWLIDKKELYLKFDDKWINDSL